MKVRVVRFRRRVVTWTLDCAICLDPIAPWRELVAVDAVGSPRAICTSCAHAVGVAIHAGSASWTDESRAFS